MRAMTHRAHVPANITAISAAATTRSSNKRATIITCTQTILPCTKGSVQATLDHSSSLSVQRRNIVSWALAGGLVLGFNVTDQSALAAGKRGAAPPPTEKNDPNVSGVLAKVLASKKRKEAMKESMAKLRERGKPISDK